VLQLNEATALVLAQRRQTTAQPVTGMEFFHTHVAPDALAAVRATLESTRLSEGIRVKAFETALSEQLGLVRPAAVNSGTSALHLALVVAGVGPGDEVILPPQTFIATGLAILMCGAKPVFADIDPTTGNLSPTGFAAAITARTKAAIPVHWGGLPCDMAEINSIAAQRDIAVVEDAAHAIGASYRGQAVGSLSRFTAFSFQAIKHLTTGDGGAICCLDERDASEVFRRRWFGIDRAASPMSELGEREYNLTDIGYKYHLNDYCAALGLANLPDLPRRLARRRAIAAQFDAALAGVAGIQHLARPDDRVSSWWLYGMRVQRRLDFVRALRDRGVPTSVCHLRIDSNTVFGGLGDLPHAAIFDAEQINLPVHEGLTEADVAQIIDAVRAGW
jgi:perosamine synthetase